MVPPLHASYCLSSSFLHDLRSNGALLRRNQPSPPRRASVLKTFQDAITSLNTLQSNFAVVDAIRKSGRKMNGQALPEMITWLRKIGYQPSDLNPLNTIHIAGTKGKGSTAAFISSILNGFREAQVENAPKKIGLYTSPHLRFVRERIQINGQPLTEQEFSRYFFETWDRLEASAAQAGEDPKSTAAKPVYFRFLTLMAFHTYLSEAVDCAIIECGIGGAYDSTNILPSPAVTGITSLGIDHEGVLGGTIEEIAWHKAGIIKTRPADQERLKCFTPSSQPALAKTVLAQVADEKAADLIFTDVDPRISSGELALGLNASFQQVNASLALAIAKSFLSSRRVDTSTPEAQEHIKRGLSSVSWPGRCDTRVDKVNSNITWYTDGGHTLESIELAGKWFSEQVNLKRQQLEDDPTSSAHLSSQTSGKTQTQSTTRSDANKNPPKIRTYLIFNQQTRDAPSLATALYKTLLSSLSSNSDSTSSTGQSSPSPFHTVIFTPNTTYSPTTSSPKSTQQHPQPQPKQSADLTATNIDSSAVAALTVQTDLGKTWNVLDPHATVAVVRSVQDAVFIIRGINTNIDGATNILRGLDRNGPWKSNEDEDEDVHKLVLVTGSLHLVGAFLEVFEAGSGT